jgi:hypothetical protein
MKIKLEDIDAASIVMRAAIPAKLEICGIYFLVRSASVVYVGQSTNIMHRIKEHMRGRDKYFDSYTFIECEKAILNYVEYYFISKFSPEYNKAVIKVKRPDDIESCSIHVIDAGSDYYASIADELRVSSYKKELTTLERNIEINIKKLDLFRQVNKHIRDRMTPLPVLASQKREDIKNNRIVDHVIVRLFKATDASFSAEYEFADELKTLQRRKEELIKLTKKFKNRRKHINEKISNITKQIENEYKAEELRVKTAAATNHSAIMKGIAESIIHDVCGDREAIGEAINAAVIKAVYDTLASAVLTTGAHLQNARDRGHDHFIRKAKEVIYANANRAMPDTEPVRNIVIPFA